MAAVLSAPPPALLCLAVFKSLTFAIFLIPNSNSSGIAGFVKSEIFLTLISLSIFFGSVCFFAKNKKLALTIDYQPFTL